VVNSFDRALLIQIRWQHERGNSHDVRHIFELALAICEKSNTGAPTPLIGDLYHSLGAIANETNDAVACLKHNTRLFEIRQEVYAQNGIKDYRYASGYAQLGIALMMNKELDRAIKAFGDSLEAFSQTSNFNKDMLSVPLADIGFALWLNGDLELAAEKLEGGIRDREELFGKNDRVSFKFVFLTHFPFSRRTS
jgi:tetratricopeptide (TPR) repeat protein